jgi:hypothetical protein
MKSNLFSMTILLISLFTMTACSEKDELPETNERTLPEITFEGKQILACHVNGELFISEPYEQWLVESYRPKALLFSDSILLISGDDQTVMEGAHISLVQIYDERRNVYKPGYKLEGFHTYFNDNSPLGGRQFSILKSEPHEMEILYEDDNIIAGTFYFTAVSQDGDTVRITDGRYDLKKGL